MRFQPSIPIARLVGEMKGASSHAIAHELAPEFRWQSGYGAFTLAEGDVPSVGGYVHDQKRRHAMDQLLPTLEEIPR